MSRKKRDEETFDEILLKILFVTILLFAGSWYFEYREGMYATGGVIAIIISSLLIYLFYFYYRNQRIKKLNTLMQNDLDKFIHRNGRGPGKIKIGGYKFSENAIDTIRDELSKRHQLKLSQSDIEKILQLTIDDEERQLIINNTFAEQPKALQSLSGTEFEQLLQRLFIAQGYQVQLNGRSGDQGADLIISKDGARTAVQAKRYQKAVSNSAIQEAVAAKAVHDCSFAMVVTNSNFTRGAFDNAKANGVTLIWGKELRKQLKETLNEVWV